MRLFFCCIVQHFQKKTFSYLTFFPVFLSSAFCWLLFIRSLDCLHFPADLCSEGLDFDLRLPLASVLRIPFTTTPLAARIGSTLAVPVFQPQNFLNVPTGATHFRLVNAVSAISDYVFNAESKVYEPKVVDQNGVSGMAYLETPVIPQYLRAFMPPVKPAGPSANIRRIVFDCRSFS